MAVTFAVPRAGSGHLARALRQPMTIAGLILTALLLGAGLLAPLLTAHDPLAQGPDALTGPSAAHLLGTDEFGRDLFSRTLFGLRQDAVVAGVAVPLAALIGVTLGLLSGLTGWLDVLIQRGFDVMLAFTALVMGVTVAAIVGPGMSAVVVTVVLVNIPLFGRVTRTAVLAQKNRDYVVAAELVGGSGSRVLLRHVLPNSVDGIVVQAALSLALAVFIEGAMSFVGIGVRPPDPSLGALLRTSINFLEQNTAYALGPIVAVTLLVLGFQLVADGVGKGLLRR
ncbi:ABC transporter permease [Actinokineospora sp. HUAS TT18]|uniref:ABC transporter permease n=1 Tax=Actinokineospora sp. HUAS TT18 TaxID=3447451 RepID=UPI003F528304